MLSDLIFRNLYSLVKNRDLLDFVIHSPDIEVFSRK